MHVKHVRTVKVMYAYHLAKTAKVMYAYHLVRTVKELLVNLVNGHVIIKYVNLAPKTVNVQMSALAVIVVIVVNIHVVTRCVKVYVNMNVKVLAKDLVKPLVKEIVKHVLNSANVLIIALVATQVNAVANVCSWENAVVIAAKINFIYV